jgi:multicomponent Na+:H+ antiporter subunit D
MLTVDAMSAFMGIIAGLLALVAFPFALKYIPEEEGKNLSLTLGVLLLAGIMGMSYTGDLFNFFVFLEVTSIAACGIIGFRTWTSRAPEAAFKTMLLFSLSGLFFLLALAFLYGEYGGFEFGVSRGADKGFGGGPAGASLVFGRASYEGCGRARAFLGSRCLWRSARG